MRVIAQQGDTVDSLCWRHLGTTDAVEQTLSDNPGLGALGPVLPIGTAITLPDQAAPAADNRNLIQLWD